MSRISRRKWGPKEYGTETIKGLFELFDAVIYENLRITSDELDFITEHATDEELGYLVTERPTFSERRKIIFQVNKFTEEFSKSNTIIENI